MTKITFTLSGKSQVIYCPEAKADDAWANFLKTIKQGDPQPENVVRSVVEKAGE